MSVKKVNSRSDMDFTFEKRRRRRKRPTVERRAERKKKGGERDRKQSKSSRVDFVPLFFAVSVPLQLLNRFDLDGYQFC